MAKLRGVELSYAEYMDERREELNSITDDGKRLDRKIELMSMWIEPRIEQINLRKTKEVIEG